MRLHRLDYQDDDHGTIVEWFASQREGEARRRDLAADHFIFSLKAVEVPTNKADLIHWLNLYLNCDNG